MNDILFFNLSPHHPIANQLVQEMGIHLGQYEIRHFPDGETYLRVNESVEGVPTVIFCDLFQPNAQLFPLLSFAENLKELGAVDVCLVTPYLPYMRQDKRFHSGESITSKHFARHLSIAFDGLITVDPHLHRYPTLDCVYDLKGEVCTAQSVITQYLKDHPENMILIGPDEESEQWVSAIAKAADRPFQILLKERSGDYSVTVSQPQLEAYKGFRPVLVDDIISSGRTMLRTIEHLQRADMGKPLVIGVHGIFANDAFSLLEKVADIQTCNSIIHETNSLDLTPVIAQRLTQYINELTY